MDLRISWGDAGADLSLEDGDLAVDEGLVTPALVSLFSDGLAELDQSLPPLEQDRRGYWAQDPSDPYGSLLWTLQREKVTRETAARAKDYAEKALAWLVQQGIARSVVAESQYLPGQVLSLDVQITRGTARRWASLWEAVEQARIRTGGLLLQLSTA